MLLLTGAATSTGVDPAVKRTTSPTNFVHAFLRRCGRGGEGSRGINAALAGLGLAYLLEDVARAYLDEGRLKCVLEDWCPPYPGYHLYYPSRRQPSPAFALLVDALRYRG